MVEQRLIVHATSSHHHMDTYKQILEYCIREWYKSFDGINSFDVAEQLNIEHKRVRKAYKAFKRNNQGTLDEDVVLYPVEDAQEKNTPEKIHTTIFYPSKQCLEMNIQNQELAKQEAPEFKKRLNLGHKRSEVSYFSLSVLQKYLDSPAKYNVQDSLCGGFISSNQNYLSTLPEEQQQEEFIKNIRYGKRKLDDKKQVVTAILEDLCTLPEEEQQHWHLSEIENPDFSLFDPEYHKYHLRFYSSSTVNSYNPIQGLRRTLKKINALPNMGKLFKNISGNNLSYPVNKNRDEFCSCCDKLYKIIGPENLNREVLKRYLRRNYNYAKEDFIDAKTEQPLSNEQLFGRLLKEVGFMTYSVDKLIKFIKRHKIPADHRIRAARYKEPDYLTEYKKLCQSMMVSFDILYQMLNKKMSPSKNS